MKIVRISQSNRSFKEINSLVIIMAALSTAFDVRLNRSTNYIPGANITIEGLTIRKIIRLPIYGPIEAAVQNLQPNFIELTILDNPKIKPEIPVKQDINISFLDTIKLHLFTSFCNLLRKQLL
jgi:hypothetical protein